MFDFTPDELRVFSKIASGDSVENHPREIVESLMEQNYLSDDSGTITLPAIVWSLWQKHLKDTQT